MLDSLHRRDANTVYGDCTGWMAGGKGRDWVGEVTFHSGETLNWTNQR